MKMKIKMISLNKTVIMKKAIKSNSGSEFVSEVGTNCKGEIIVETDDFEIGDIVVYNPVKVISIDEILYSKPEDLLAMVKLEK